MSFERLRRFPSNRRASVVIEPSGSYLTTRRESCSQITIRPCLSTVAPLAPPDFSLMISFWADSAIGGLAGFPSVLFGPVGHGAHAVDEWVSLESLVRVYEVVKRVVEESL